MPVKQVGYAIIYISMDCPVCHSLFRGGSDKIRLQVGGKVKMPVYVVDVRTLTMQEIASIWDWTLTDHGLVLRVTVPYLVIYCGDGRIVWKGEIKPLFGTEFTATDLKKITTIINSAQIKCHVHENDRGATTPGGNEEEAEEKPKRRRRRKSGSVQVNEVQES